MEEKTLEIISIDESGISGTTGHSVYVFIFIHLKDYVSVSNHIIQIEKELKLGYIHRNEMSWRLRNKVARKLQILDFTVQAVVHQNPIFPDIAFKSSLLHILTDIHHAYRIFIDGNKNREYKTQINKLLKSKNLKTYKIKFVNDISEATLRLADFIAGSIRSFLDNPDNTDAGTIFKTFEHKIIHIHKTK
mgnify:CR=1 FL=1